MMKKISLLLVFVLIVSTVEARSRPTPKPKPIPVRPAGYGPRYTTGTDQNVLLPQNAIVINAGTNIQTKVKSAPEGAIFVLKGAHKPNYTIYPKNRQQFIGAPNSSLIGTVKTAFDVNGCSGILLKNLNIQGYIPPEGNYIIEGGSWNWGEIVQCEISKIGGNGGCVRVGTAMRRCKLHDAKYGFSIYFRDNAIVEDCEIYNCLDGCKLWNTTNCIVRYCWSYNNSGVGLWADDNNEFGVFEYNAVQSNGSHGIFQEIGYTFDICNNYASGSHSDIKAGISIVKSSDVHVYNNVVEDCDRGIMIFEETVGNQSGDNPKYGSPWESFDCQIYNNIGRRCKVFTGVRSWGGDATEPEDNNQFYDNEYYYPLTNYPFDWNGVVDWSEWNDLGFDIEGIFVR